MADPWMIYGATGFTGRHVAAEARRRGLTPVLAGRSREAVRALATELDLPWRVFDLASPDRTAAGLEDIDVVLHCAGPFSATHPPMLAACLAAGTHYLDITGELPVFEALQARALDLRRAGLTAVSGVGFDVVPTDGVAARLAAALPEATTLRLGIGLTEVSPGTARTAVELLALGGRRRDRGLIVAEPLAVRSWSVRRGAQAFTGVNFAWGDVVTAYVTTGIPTVETYLDVPWFERVALRATTPLLPLVRQPHVQALLKRLAGRAPGPSTTRMREGRSVVWGEVTDARGRRLAARLEGPEAYAFTVVAALAAVERVRAGGVPPGALTPALAFGADFATTLPGVTLAVFEPDPATPRA